MKLTGHATLLKVFQKSFRGREGDEVVYHSARLVDDEANVIDCVVDKDLVPSVKNIIDSKGTALLNFFVITGGKAKTRLLDFVPDDQAVASRRVEVRSEEDIEVVPDPVEA